MRWMSLHTFVSRKRTSTRERDASNEREKKRKRDDDTTRRRRRRRLASTTPSSSASSSPSASFTRRVVVVKILREKKKVSVRMDDVPTQRDDDGRVDRLRRALARPGAAGRRGDLRFARGRDERRRRPRVRRHRRRHSVPIGAGVSRRVETLRNGPHKRRRRRDDDGMSDTKKRRK